MRAQLNGSSWTETCIVLSNAMDSCLQQVDHQRLENDLACLAADETSQTCLMTDKAAKIMHHLISCKAGPSATAPLSMGMHSDMSDSAVFAYTLGMQP